MVFTADCGPRPENAVRYTSAYGGPPHYQWHGFSGPKGGAVNTISKWADRLRPPPSGMRNELS